MWGKKLMQSGQLCFHKTEQFLSQSYKGKKIITKKSGIAKCGMISTARSSG